MKYIRVSLKGLVVKGLLILCVAVAFGAAVVATHPDSVSAASSLRNSIQGTLRNSKLPGTGDSGAANAVDPIDIVFNVISFVLGVLGVVAFILMIYAGFLWMTSAGNQEKIKKAKGILKEATIGLAIIFASYGLTTFVIQRFVGVTGSSAPSGGAPDTIPDTGGT